MEVEVIKAKNKFDDSAKQRYKDRLRVAAYCRVSTDDKEQEKSYNSMIKHYTALIQENKLWTFAGIYADPAVTGTKVDKRYDYCKKYPKICEKYIRYLEICENVERN